MDQKLDKITFARLLRYHQTEVEKLLWAKLRDKRLVGVKFRRQQTIGHYIVDLVSFERKLIIELVLEVIYRKLNTPHPFLLKAKRPLPQGERVARSNIV